MDAIVTARVPVELKERGNSVLKQIGATPTQLVNAAYDFLLKEQRLPSATIELGDLKMGARLLSGSQAAKVSRSLDAMHIGRFDAGDFDEQLAKAREERYAHTA